MEIPIPPKINTAFPMGFATVAKAVIQRKAMAKRATNTQTHTFLGMEGKNNAHRLDK